MLRAKLAMIAAALLVLGSIGWALWRMQDAAPDAQAGELMRAAAGALHHVPVKGIVATRIRISDGWREAHAEVHRGGGRARVHYLDGPAAGVTLIRQGRDVWATKEGDENLRRLGLSADPSEEMARQLMQDNYTARVMGRRQVAGRPVTIVVAKGHHGAVTLGVDQETSFPLLMERYDRDGELRVSTVYQDADFSVQPPAMAETPPDAGNGHRRGQRFDTIEQLKAHVTFTLYQPTWLPDGFALKDCHLRERESLAGVALRYSDGLQSIVVMQRPSSGERPEAGSVRREGSDHVRDRVGEHSGSRRGQRGEGRQPRGGSRPEGMHPPRGLMNLPGGPTGDAVRRYIDGTMVIVMGPVSKEDLARMADSFKPVP